MTYHVAVYGSLLSGLHNHDRWMEGAELVGTGIAPGKMFSLGQFPGAVYPDDPYSEGAPWMKVEVYEVPERTFQGLDRLEGHPQFYRRQQVLVNMDDTDGDVECWVYYLPSEDGLVQRMGQEVPDGDWRKFLQGRGPE